MLMIFFFKGKNYVNKLFYCNEELIISHKIVKFFWHAFIKIRYNVTTDKNIKIITALAQTKYNCVVLL